MKFAVPHLRPHLVQRHLTLARFTLAHLTLATRVSRFRWLRSQADAFAGLCLDAGLRWGVNRRSGIGFSLAVGQQLGPALLAVVLLLSGSLLGTSVQAQEDAPAAADSEQEAGPVQWETDVAAAQQAAQDSDKDLLFNFTGSDWCVWCIRLDKEVFSQSDFAPATEQFVFVKLDFPRDKSGMGDELQKQNAEWQTKLEVGGFPTIYLLDAQARPYAKAGYQPGGPEPYLKKLEQLQDVRRKRDELFAEAAQAEGDAAAQLLDQALSLMDESLVTTFYEDRIKQIVELDPDDSTGLRTKYYAAQDKETRKSLLARIDLAARTQPPALAVKTIDQALGEFTLPPLMKIDALQTKLRLLRASGQDEAVTQLLDQMIALDGIPQETREQLVVQKIYNMVGAGEEEAAVQLLNDMIASTISNLELCIARGELYDRLGKFEQAVDAYDYIIKSGVRDPERLAEVIIAKSDSLASLDRIDDALQLIEDFATASTTPDYLKSDLYLQKAMLYRETGKKDAAELAEYRALEFAESPEMREELLLIIEQLRKIDD